MALNYYKLSLKLLLATNVILLASCNRTIYYCGTLVNPNATFEYDIIDTINQNNSQIYFIKGSITKDHHPVIGAIIFLPEFKTGIQSNWNGNFYLEIPIQNKKMIDTSTVEFSYVNYKTLKLSLREIINKEININMKE